MFVTQTRLQTLILVSRIDKLWKKFQGGGVVTYAELVRLMSHYGFVEIKGTGAKRKFENDKGKQLVIHEPHPDKNLKDYQKKDARKFIREHMGSL